MMQHDPDSVQMLKGSVKNYDWGRPARDSKVAKLFLENARSGPRTRRSLVNWEPKPDAPFAEFWIGTHELGPSVLFSGKKNETLKSWLSRNPHFLGHKVQEKWGSDLPFLIKVLSVAKATPMRDPHVHGMALAITEFEALVGFISFEELQAVVKDVPEVWNLISFGNAMSVLNQNAGEENVENQCSSVFTRIMSAEKDKVTEAVGKLKNRLIKDRQVRNLEEKENLALRLEEQRPGDVVVVASFFLNYVKLKPGEAISIGPNEVHAYMSGECMECMIACAHRDAQTPSRGPPEIMRGNAMNPHVTNYLLPSNELEIHRCHYPKPDDKPLTFPPVPTPSIFLVTGGEGLLDGFYRIMEGDVFFAAADATIPIYPVHGLILYRFGFAQV